MTLIIERAGEWINDASLESATLVRYAYSLGALVSFGIERLDQITPANVRHFMLERRKSVKPQTCNRDLAALSSFVRWMHDLGELPLDLLLELRELYLTPEALGTPYFLDAPEVLRLRASALAVHPTCALGVWVAVHTGVRLGELRSFWTDDFQLEATDPYVRVQRTRGRTNKTRRDRTAPISRAFARECLALGWGQDAPRPVFPARQRRGETVTSQYVVESTFERWLWRTQEIAMLDLTWTTCRHTYASWCVQNDMTIFKVARALGNSVAVCERHYSALMPGGDNQVERAFGKLS